MSSLPGPAGSPIHSRAPWPRAGGRRAACGPSAAPLPDLPSRTGRDLLALLSLLFGGCGPVSPFPLLWQSSWPTWAQTLQRLGPGAETGRPGGEVLAPGLWGSRAPRGETPPASAGLARSAPACCLSPPRPDAWDSCPRRPRSRRGSSRRFPSVPREDTLGTAVAVPPCRLSRIKILLPLAEPPLRLFAPQENYSAFNYWGAKCCWPPPAREADQPHHGTLFSCQWGQMSRGAGSPGCSGSAQRGGAAQGDPGRRFAVYRVYGSPVSHDFQPLPETGQEGRTLRRQVVVDPVFSEAETLSLCACLLF